MEEQTMRQWQGVVELLHDGVQGAAAAIEAAQAEITAVPYGVLRHVPLAAGPAAAAERAQRDITRLAYGSVRVVTGVTAAAALLLLKLHHVARAR